MPLEKKILNKENTIGIWKISETISQLERMIDLSGSDARRYQEIQNEPRKKQFLASRILLSENRGISKPVNVLYDKNGKPHIRHSDHHISISHSGIYAAVIVNKLSSTGIDIELIKPGIERIAKKFLNEAELENSNGKDKKEKMHIYWGAKECLYKLHGKKGLIFTKNLLIDKFDYKKKGRITGSIKAKDSDKKYVLAYEKINEYMLVYIFKEKN